MLTLCTGCRRHVRVAEHACPFCGGSLAQPRATTTNARLARGALFAFASSVAACGGSTESPSPVTDTGSLSAAYGAPADIGPADTGSDASDAASDGSVVDSGEPMADYGAPPPPDGG